MLDAEKQVNEITRVWRAGDLQAAESLARQCSIDHPKTHALVMLGRILLDQGRIDEAKQVHERVLAMHPDSSYALVGLARILRDEGEFTRAVDLFQQASRIHPWAPTFVLLGCTQRSLDHSQDAFLSFKRALELDPDCDEAMLNLAMEIKDDQPERAMALLTKVIELDPECAMAHEEIGVVGQMIGWELKQCIEHFERAIALKPERLFPHIFLARHYLDDGQIENAKRACTTFHELNKARNDIENAFLNGHIAWELQLRDIVRESIICMLHAGETGEELKYWERCAWLAQWLGERSILHEILRKVPMDTEYTESWIYRLNEALRSS